MASTNPSEQSIEELILSFLVGTQIMFEDEGKWYPQPRQTSKKRLRELPERQEN